jgi:hypothetical protein
LVISAINPDSAIESLRSWVEDETPIAKKGQEEKKGKRKKKKKERGVIERNLVCKGFGKS